jgi:hypothetical protein
MPKTRGDLCAEVLDQLGVVGAGDIPAPADLDKVDLLLDSVFEELAHRKVIYVPARGQYGKPTTGSIDDATFLPLAQAATKSVATKFGAAFGDFAAIATDGEGRLRAMQAETQIDEPIRAVYY